MRLPRPYIPLRVRVQVAERQLREAGITSEQTGQHIRLSYRLKGILFLLFGDQKVELHHRPALVNRNRLYRNGNKTVELPPGTFLHHSSDFVGYNPDANDPNYLVYLPADEHDIETRVRGQHGDYSDLAKARKRKRQERKRERNNNMGTHRIGSRNRADARRSVSNPPLRLKRRWPKRKLRSRNDLRRRK